MQKDNFKIEKNRDATFLWVRKTLYALYICIGIVAPLFSDRPLSTIYLILFIGISGILCVNKNTKLSGKEMVIFILFYSLFLILYIFYNIKGSTSLLYGLYIMTFIYLVSSIHFLIKQISKLQLSLFKLLWRVLAVLALIILIVPILSTRKDATLKLNPAIHIEYIALVVSGCSCAAVAITLFTQGNQLKNSQRIEQQSYDNQILTLIDQLSPETKKKCTELKEILQDEAYASETIKGLKFAFERQIRDDYYTNSTYKQFREDNINYQYYVAFTQFVRYFEKLSYYDLNEHTGPALHFYYIWWREFLMEVIYYFNETLNEVVESDPDIYPILIIPGWITLCKDMDDKFKKLGLKIPEAPTCTY